MRSKLLRYTRPLTAIIVIYLILLLGPIASFDIPTIARSVQANPTQLIQFLIIGVANGAIVAIIALGYTMVYGIIELINFAHGDIFMLGAFLSVVFLGGIAGQTGGVTSIIPLILLLIGAMLFTMPIIGVLNVAIERSVYRPLRHAPRLAPLITAIGVSFILQNVALTLAGSGDRSAPQIFPLEWQIPFGGASISVLSIFIFALAMALRRAEGTDIDHPIFDDGKLRIDPATFSVRYRGRDVRMTRKEFALLSELARNQGRVLTREALLDRVWGVTYYSDSRTLDVHIRRLRSKVDEPFARKLIHTVRGLGYVLEVR